ncbi:MAG: hypothetical protein EON59_06805 [Alphaproteobacteria bacterium]|nr:MAG: hypothetical protein EON59_06805 [Alphaproteobacteria bacterium]
MSNLIRTYAKSVAAMVIASLCAAIAMDLIADPIWGSFWTNFTTVFKACLGLSFTFLGLIYFIGIFAVWFPNRPTGKAE